MFASSAVLALGVAILSPGGQAVRMLADGKPQTFDLVVASNQFVTAVVEQGETDLKSVLRAPEGRIIATYDEWERGPEWISFVTADAGTYHLDVAPAGSHAKSAGVRVRFEIARPRAGDDDRWIEAETLATEARRLFRQGDQASLRQALDARRKALVLWRALERPAAALPTLVGVADVLYALNQYEDADATYREALTLSGTLRDRRTDAEILNNLAATLWARDEVGQALTALERALGLWRELKFTPGEATTLTNRGVLLWQAGDFDAARDHYSRAIRIFRVRGDRRSEAYTLNNVAMVLDTLGDRAAALERLGRAIALFRAADDRLAEGRAFVRRGRILLAMGDTPASLAAVRRGLSLISPSSDRLAEADALEQLGRVYAASGDPAAALERYSRARDMYEAVGSRRGVSDALNDAGATYLESKEYAKALDFFARALDLRRAAGLRSLEAETLIRMARAYRLSGDLEAARADADAAVAIGEQLRASVFERELRTSYAGAIQRYYSESVDVLVALHRRQPDAGFDALAFETVERARARGLVESLRETWAGISRSGAPALQVRERQLREELDYWSWQVWERADRPAPDDRAALARANVDRLLDAHASVVADLRRADPRHAEWFRAPTVPLSEIRRELVDDRTVLLEYALGDERSYVWAATSRELHVIDLPPRQEIERQIRRLYRVVSADPGGMAQATRVAQRARAAASLGAMLLAPVARQLEGRRALVVPDGALNYIPFAALTVAAHGAPLAAAHDLVMLPSSTMLTLLRHEVATRAPAPKVLAMIAAPVFDPNDARVERVGVAPVASTAPAARRLSRLPFSRDEADRILAMVPPALSLKALDFDANRGAAMSPALSAYRIVHFGTHAVRDDRHPELSGIVLSLVDPRGRKQNGFLRLQDLYNLHLGADLVVLSACETAVGVAAGGEGLASMARGFFYAGAVRVVAALWKVDDEATAAFMQLFYRAQIVDRLSTAAALRAAQQSMRGQKRWEDPYYWSGFILQGEW